MVEISQVMVQTSTRAKLPPHEGTGDGKLPRLKPIFGFRKAPQRNWNNNTLCRASIATSMNGKGAQQPNIV